MAIFYNVHRFRGGKTIRLIQEDSSDTYRFKDIVLDADFLCGAEEMSPYEDHENWDDLDRDSGVNMTLPIQFYETPEEWEGVETVTAFDIGQEFYVVVADSDWDVIDQTPECFSLEDGWTEGT